MIPTKQVFDKASSVSCIDILLFAWHMQSYNSENLGLRDIPHFYWSLVVGEIDMSRDTDIMFKARSPRYRVNKSSEKWENTPNVYKAVHGVKNLSR